MKIPLSAPDITEREIDMVVEVLRSGQLALGPRMIEFETRMAEYTGVKHAIAVNSGTSGLHLAVRALGIQEGDEVITTPFSFVASANCLLFERARPVFVDIEPETYNLDPNKIEAAITEKTRAILPVHVFGQCCEMDRIREIAAKYNLTIIEDACEAIGAEYKGRKAGSFGEAAVFAFYPNKQMTTGEGGIIVTDRDDIAELCRSMRNQGRGKEGRWLIHERLGYNYRMDEMSCALGLAQLSRIEEIMAKREKVAQEYNMRLKELDEIKIPEVKPENKISWFVYVITLAENINRELFMHELQAEGVACRAYFEPIHLQPFYCETFGYRKGDFPVCEKIASKTVALPFHNNLSETEIDYVVNVIKKAIRTAKK
ncbi:MULTISPECIES: DegT/DnrJ/EryC1/StrS aminotransferase family protein [Carboxydocella]|uniref:Perosamine synthetase n=2 Tax=Carboxydocella TaxID=178898 RepID=A0A1T4QVU3_9FIRM|nr:MULTISPECIES: DegT/DnrJ/EryC1/StrS family aminotransferase [Carboxydocella]AVX21679.1 perosamine synthetase [Carboxydocella thermautotrophica]AVX32090.1 perosamine synthetase [Carboxydocella thermautotrophica]SKA07899.1 perosamine synthetase [Carboxydocella sporoproducens DSM 16521]GAW27674.1 polysaccharide biosynthesis protein [Carboxydocella sp. ULO1]GAW31869.1 polysaccharide biosynthesis protein [Carboxydocella sp. JDF658]